MASFTDEELLAYLDESLPVARSAVIERELRGSDGLRCRLERLIAGQDQGGRTIGEIWRRTRASCPNRELWTAYLDGHVGDAMRN